MGVLEAGRVGGGGRTPIRAPFPAGSRGPALPDARPGKFPKVHPDKRGTDGLLRLVVHAARLVMEDLAREAKIA